MRRQHLERLTTCNRSVCLAPLLRGIYLWSHFSPRGHFGIERPLYPRASSRRGEEVSNVSLSPSPPPPSLMICRGRVGGQNTGRARTFLACRVAPPWCPQARACLAQGPASPSSTPCVCVWPRGGVVGVRVRRVKRRGSILIHTHSYTHNPQEEESFSTCPCPQYHHQQQRAAQSHCAVKAGAHPLLPSTAAAAAAAAAAAQQQQLHCFRSLQHTPVHTHTTQSLRPWRTAPRAATTKSW